MSTLQAIALVGVCLAAAWFVAHVLHRLAVLERQQAAQLRINANVQIAFEVGDKMRGASADRIEALAEQLQRQTEVVAVTGSGRPAIWEGCPHCAERAATPDAIRHRPTCPLRGEEQTRSIPAPPRTGTGKA